MSSPVDDQSPTKRSKLKRGVGKKGKGKRGERERGRGEREREKMEKEKLYRLYRLLRERGEIFFFLSPPLYPTRPYRSYQYIPPSIRPSVVRLSSVYPFTTQFAHFICSHRPRPSVLFLSVRVRPYVRTCPSPVRIIKIVEVIERTNERNSK